MSVSGLGRQEAGGQGGTKGPAALPTLSPLPSLPRHDVVEVAGLTSFSFGEDDECRYVMIFKKVKHLSSPLSPVSFPACMLPGKEERDKTCMWGVPVVVQWLTNPTRNHEVVGSILGLAQWVKDLALP